jgi:hypothetical protein
VTEESDFQVFAMRYLASMEKFCCLQRTLRYVAPT